MNEEPLPAHARVARAQCYYERVRRICLSPEYKEDYEALFDIGYGSADELKSQYAAAFGSSFDAMDPTLADLFATVETDERNYDYERDICSDTRMFHGMTLDMVIMSCFFAMTQGFCSNADTDDLETFLRSVEWRLPDVRFEYDVRCVKPTPSPFARPPGTHASVVCA